MTSQPHIPSDVSVSNNFASCDLTYFQLSYCLWSTSIQLLYFHHIYLYCSNLVEKFEATLLAPKHVWYQTFLFLEDVTLDIFTPTLDEYVCTVVKCQKYKSTFAFVIWRKCQKQAFRQFAIVAETSEENCQIFVNLCDLQLISHFRYDKRFLMFYALGLRGLVLHLRKDNVNSNFLARTITGIL